MKQQRQEHAKDKDIRTKEFNDAKINIQSKFMEELEVEGHKLDLRVFMQEVMKESSYMFQAGLKVYETLKKDRDNYGEIHPK